MQQKIVWTPKQREALALMREPANKHVMLVGGARSGKTYLEVSGIVYRAMKYPESRHLIARLRFAHAKLSIWMDTLAKVLKDQADPASHRANETDHFIKFSNGSEIWVDGLDDKTRVDKILGREYATIFFNEISQIPYDTVTTVVTRLSQNVTGCRNVAWYDLNPAGNLHWANQLFIKGVRPDGTETGPGYAHLYINPYDNQENLPDGYIQDVLERLPEHKRRRFLLGEWSDPEGTIFQNWHMIDEIPDEVQLHSRRAYGLDFGFSVDPAALVAVYMNGDDLYIDELLYGTGMTSTDIAEEMVDHVDHEPTIYADSGSPEAIEAIRRYGFDVVGVAKPHESIQFGIDWLLSKRVHVTGRSVNIWNEQANYTWKERGTNVGLGKPKPIDDFNHAMDATRYACREWMEPHGRVAEWSAEDLGL